MVIKKIKTYTLILFSDFLILVFVSSCNCKKQHDWSDHSNHIESIEGITIDFYTPKNYTKGIRNQRECSPFFNDMSIMSNNNSIIYFSPEEEMSFISLSVNDISEQIQYAKTHNLDSSDSAAVKSLVSGDLKCGVRIPLIYQDVDNNGNRYFLIMYFSRYSRSNMDYRYNPIIDDNTLPMDSIESECYYYSIIDNKEIVIENYSLQSIEKFSFMEFFSMLNSVKIFHK